MICLAWNCQGLGGYRTVRSLEDLVRANNPHIIFQAETKLHARKIENIKMKLDFNGVAVSSRGRSGGFAMLWPKDINILLQSFSSCHIDVNICDEKCAYVWRFSGFYGDPNEHERYKSWDFRRRLSSLSTLPWLCVGDFNAILSLTEKYGVTDICFRAITDFGECLRDAGLSDLGFVGYPYTWSNNRTSPHLIEERIDRACGSDGWRSFFPRFQVAHLETLNSDHRPICINLKYSRFSHSR